MIRNFLWFPANDVNAAIKAIRLAQKKSDEFLTNVISNDTKEEPQKKIKTNQDNEQEGTSEEGPNDQIEEEAKEVDNNNVDEIIPVQPDIELEKTQS